MNFLCDKVQSIAASLLALFFSSPGKLTVLIMPLPSGSGKETLFRDEG
jgi:hypothetical protein